MNILLIDNYDSFTFNLVQILRESNLCRFSVIKNDKVSVDHCRTFDKIMISPGPGLPAQAGNIIEIIKKTGQNIPILGICLGHQAIAEAFGGRLQNLDDIFHGEASRISLIKDDFLWHSLPKNIQGGRYHSWVVDKDKIPPCLEVIAKDEAGNIMALRHKTLKIRGIQFHPESILTPDGTKIIENWLKS